MKLKYNNKHYCVNPCAKDKFSTYIIEPILFLVSATVVSLCLWTFMWILGVITQGIIFLVFDDILISFINKYTLLGAVVTVLLSLLIGIGILITLLIKEVQAFMVLKTQQKYNKIIKPKCTLFIECED